MKTIYTNPMRVLFALLIIASFIVSCSNEDSKEIKEPVIKAVLPQPFHSHKTIEVIPGLTYDILGWGRGAEESGSYLILRSDSTGNKYKAISGELEGRIVDAWNMDMDTDGNPEIFIQAAGSGKDNYLSMYVFEFNDSGSYSEIRFPELRSSTKEIYRGKDSLYVKEGVLYREFPTFEEADTSGLKPTGKKIVEYKLKGNSFSVDEVKPG